MQKNIKSNLQKLKQEIFAHKVIYLILFIVLVWAFWLRIYRINELLGFYYDQGRDALAVWNLLHKFDIPFIGPTTGIAGIFRGPYYFYLIAPFYLLGGGNPVWPSIFLSFTTILAIGLAYYLGFKIHSRIAGLIAAFIAGLSFNLVISSRWLSNPTPMFLLSMLLVFVMLKITESDKIKAKIYWPILSFIFGLSLFHFGSSGEAFYLPSLLVFAIWQRKKLPTRKYFLLSIAAFLITILPLILFDLKNHGLLVTNIKNFVVGNGNGGTSFGFPSWRQIGDKIAFLYDVFTNKIFNGRYTKENIFLAVILFAFIYKLQNLIKNNGLKILLLLFTTGCIGIIVFQGNFGNIYDYYLTGYYLIFVLLFSVALGEIWRNKLGKIFVLYFLYWFLTNNYEILQYKLTDGLDGPNSIALKNQKQALDWVYANSKGEKFNTDVYVPPVISYAYDYLFLWQDSTRHQVVDGSQRISLLYTLYEQDPPYPERLEAWLARQKGIGKVEESARFGGITVERRTRIKY